MNHATAARFLLAVCFLVLLFNGGARFAIGLVLHPMAHDLAWSRSALSASVTVFMVLSACALPLIGQLVDRFGARAVLGASVLLSALGLASMSFIERPWEALLFYGVVFAIGTAGTSVTPVGVLLSRWFPHRMGMANSIAISGMGVGQLLVILVLAVQLTTFGWRGSFLALGVATLVCVLPLVLAMGKAGPAPAPAASPVPGRGARTGAGMGAGAGTGTATGKGAPAAAEGRAVTLREALASRRLQLLLLIYVVCGFQDFLVATHMVAFALDEGVDMLLAGNMLAFMGLTGLVGVLLAGVLNDRYGPAFPTALCFALRIVLCALLLASREPAVIVGAALLYGVTFWMTAPLTVVFAREVAGLALLGTISGLITMAHHAAGGLGALAGASVFDIYGSYHRAFVAMLVLSVIALGLTLVLPRSRPR